MASESESQPPPSDLPGVDEDLHCFNCGYNLRGLSGDPRRCPECFHEYSLSDLRAEARSRVLTRFERIQRDLDARAKLCALPAGVAILLVLACPFSPNWLLYWRSPFAVTAAVCWLTGFVLFGVRCRESRGGR